MKGVEQPQNSDSYQNLTGYRIPPLKLTAYLEYNPTQQWSHRVQGTYFASKDYRLDGKSSFGRRYTSGYATVDVISRWTIDDKNKVTVGVQNLFNRYYYPLYSQLMRNSNNTSHLHAAGALLTVSYTHQWRSEEQTSELQTLMRISYAVFCLQKNISTNSKTT